MVYVDIILTTIVFFITIYLYMELLHPGSMKIKIERNMPRIFRIIYYIMLLTLLWKFVSNIENIAVFLVQNIK